MVIYTRLRYPDGILQFEQDNHPAHTSKSIRYWFANTHDIEMIDWPRRSPDLNSIKNTWDKVQKHTRNPSSRLVATHPVF